MKSVVFVLEGLNSLSATYFFYYFYFYTQARFHFGAQQNLVLAAFQGAVYAVGSFYGGRFAQRFGYFTAIRVGAAVMVFAMLACSFASTLSLAVVLFLVATVGLTMTWPALEALTSEGEAEVRLQSMVGIYNFVWALTAGFGYFTGGAMFHKWGVKSTFYVPAALLAVECLLATWLAAVQERLLPSSAAANFSVLQSTPETFAGPIPRSTFLKMAWLANPMAYLSINTVISTIPSLARRMHFTPETAGFVCSIWLFARAAAFVALRLWPGWHYRFRYLSASYLLMMLSFGSMLLALNIWMLLLAQIFFGIGLGLIYYSSLFYSMDAGDAKGEHGGIHEAAIGIGNASGPATAAASLYLFHDAHGSATGAVCLLLTAGFAGLLWLRFKKSG